MWDCEMNKKVVIFSYHYYNSKNKAGFHNIALAFKRLGYDVHFITSPVSLLSFIKGDVRIFNNKFFKNIFTIQNFEGIKSYINFNYFHLVNRNSILIEKFLLKFFKLNKRLYNVLKDAEFIIMESSLSLLFVSEIKSINPKAKFIYRMSDDIYELNLPNILKENHDNIIKYFDLISVPSFYMYRKYKNLYPDLNIKLHFHGIEKNLFDKCLNNPYRSGSYNAVFIGMSYLDWSFLEIASRIFDNITFHIIGNFTPKVKLKNIKYYGVLPFKDTIGYIKYADLGLAIRRGGNENLVRTLDSSLKIIQYTYCKLPIILPELIETERENFFKYSYDDEKSIKSAIESALQFDRVSFTPHGILTWEELAERALP